MSDSFPTKAERTRGLTLALRWIQELSDGDFIASKNYNKTHFCAWPGERVLDKDLKEVVEVVNEWAHHLRLPHRVYWYAGELIPYDFEEAESVGTTGPVSGVQR